MKQIVTILLVFSSLFLFSQPYTNQSDWEKYFENANRKLDPIEGIWSRSSKKKIYNYYKDLVYTENINRSSLYAIYNENGIYKAFAFDVEADNNYARISFLSTAMQNIYTMNILYPQTNSRAGANCTIENNGLLLFEYEKPLEQLQKDFYLSGGVKWVNDGASVVFADKWIKLFPKINISPTHVPLFGTGFGISSNGIIVTNFHLIDGAKTIRVRGINSDFNKTYNAKVLVSDKNNDLALIQIDDYGFTSIGTIPYTIKSGLGGVGENIFVLGYPLRATMGDEIKLTNGIVSSRTGFQGDITSYQISAPIQPGNSGGPLFDSQGNLIGIINAKHGGAENVTYAVKTSYLKGLIELLPSYPKLQTVNTLAGKTLTQQVVLAKKFVYIIEVE